MCQSIRKEGLVLDFILENTDYFMTANVTFTPQNGEQKCSACIKASASAQGVHDHQKFYISQLEPMIIRRVTEKKNIPLESDEGISVVEHVESKLMPKDHAERPYFCKGCFGSLWVILDERKKLQRASRKERMSCSLNEPLL